MTLVIVTHEMGFARKVADRIVFMEDGAIVEDTPTGQFFAKPRSDRAARFLDRILTH
jgi:glutamate/aspartate transport system ATP-binding protein